MAAIKSFTDINQSKKLAEILPLESADMFLLAVGDTLRIHVLTEPLSNYCHWENCPCWSLAALLDVLPEYNLQKTSWGNKTEYKIVVTTDEDNYASKNYNNPVDACYEMILKLHEQKLL